MDDRRWGSVARYPYTPSTPSTPSPIVYRLSSIVHEMSSAQNTNANNASLPLREAAIFWGPPVLWMLAIFYLSAQSALGEMSGPPALMVARKFGHIFEYAALALLLGRALLYTWRTHGKALSRALLSRAWAVGVALSALYAMTDEFHQT